MSDQTPPDKYWCTPVADRLALIVDACDYFRHLRRVILATQRQLLLIGWDFDLEIEMLPGDSDAEGNAPDGLPNMLGPFLEAVIERNRDLEIYMLKWNGAVLVAPGRLAPGAALAAFGSGRIHFALDGHHPFGACHHQKIVVADDSIAFCGGIDMTENRWDTSGHLPDDPRRTHRDGSPAAPWHDATSAVSGAAASALGDLARQRWQRARGGALPAPTAPNRHIWPEALTVDARNVTLAIARTEPPFNGAPLVNEIEESLLDAIRNAQRSIYIESQYFAGDTVCDALAARLSEPGGPQIVLINPEHALSAFEDDAMHELRDRMLARLRAADSEDRFRVFYPVTSAGQPIYVHAKIFIADADILHIGSANMNNRSMGFDTECNLVITGRHRLISGFRSKLLSEHLNVQTEVFEQALARHDTLIAALEALNSARGRGLRELGKRVSTPRGVALAETGLMNPRFQPDEGASTGQGIRPRHIVAVLLATLAGYLGWRGWRAPK